MPFLHWQMHHPLGSGKYYNPHNLTDINYRFTKKIIIWHYYSLKRSCNVNIVYRVNELG